MEIYPTLKAVLEAQNPEVYDSLPISEILENLANKEASRFFKFFKVEAQLKSLLETPTPQVDDFVKLLDAFKNLAEKEASQKSILFLENADSLSILERGNDADQKVLELLIQGMIDYVKEDDGNATDSKQRCHIFLASNDSFFYSWLLKYIGSESLFNKVVIGDLNFEQAEKFNQKKCKKNIVRNPMDFAQQIYPYLGISKNV
jgi:hypothetical protein